MYKLIAIITLIAALINLQAGEIRRKEDSYQKTGPAISAQGIDCAAYHEPACGIGDAAEHVHE